MAGSCSPKPLLANTSALQAQSTLALPYSDICSWCSFHYWRIHPQYWEDRLKRGLALGLNTVQAMPTGIGYSLESSCSVLTAEACAEPQLRGSLV